MKKNIKVFYCSKCKEPFNHKDDCAWHDWEQHSKIACMYEKKHGGGCDHPLTLCDPTKCKLVEL
jgi:hypothetical protein